MNLLLTFLIWLKLAPCITINWRTTLQTFESSAGYPSTLKADTHVLFPIRVLDAVDVTV